MPKIFQRIHGGNNRVKSFVYISGGYSQVTANSLQDRGGELVLNGARVTMHSIVQVWADDGYAGKRAAFARRRHKMALDPRQCMRAVVRSLWRVGGIG